MRVQVSLPALIITGGYKINNNMSIIDQINYTLRFHSSNLASQDKYTRFLELSEFKRNLEQELYLLNNSCKKDNRLT